jgi:hypothetical protein
VGVDWINIVQWRALVNTVMNLLVLKVEQLSVSQEGFYSMDLVISSF